MSSNNIEIESKVLLSKGDADRIIRKLHFPEKEIVQTNYYLDSDERILKKYDMILRVREENDIIQLTMKAPLSEGLLEKNQRLTTDETDALINRNIFPRGDISEFLEILHIDPASLKVLANLTTHRRAISYLGTKLDISKNVYSGKTDYELECDSDSALKSQNTLKDVCEDFNIPFKLNTISKENRAIAAALGEKK